MNDDRLLHYLFRCLYDSNRPFLTIASKFMRNGTDIDCPTVTNWHLTWRLEK